MRTCILVLLSLGFVLVPDAGTQGPGSKDTVVIPVTGWSGPKMDSLELLVLEIMDRHGIPGASLAIAKNGKLVFAKGFGFMNAAQNQATRPDTLFAVASISKPITALAILKLIEEGKLKLDDPVLPLLAHIRPPRGARVDPRFGQITVRQLLNHSGGWDRNKSGDPINWAPQISRKLGLTGPPSSEQFISFMLAMPLDFEPGTREVYSNVGYIMLGKIIEKVSGQGYEAYVRKSVLAPMGIKAARVHKGQKTYFENESGRFVPGTGALIPPLQLPMLEAAGGWSISTVDLVKLMTSLDATRGKPFFGEVMFKTMMAPPPPPIKPRPNGTYPGLGFYFVQSTDEGLAFAQNGSWHGARAFMKRMPTKTCMALAFNASMEPDILDMQLVKDAVHKVRETVENFRDYPDVDLFKEFER